MDTGETTGAKQAPRRPGVEAEEPPYEGVAGQTRLESVHVTIPGGYVRSVRVYTAVNVVTDPDLRAPAIANALHRFEGGEELAIPFVFHDPAERRFALVLPESLRHRELLERAKLLQRLAEDTDHAISPYVREASVVIGPTELSDYLAHRGGRAGMSRAREEELEVRESELDSRYAQLAAREKDVTSRESSLVKSEEEMTVRRQEIEKQVERLVEREKRLHARAEDVTRREDEVRLANEERTAAQRDLSVREEELDRRLEVLRQREAELARPQEAPARPRSVPPPAPASAPPPRPSSDASEDDVEELDDIEPIRTDTNLQLADAVELLEDDDERDRISATDVEEIVDEDDVEEIDDVDAVREVTGVEPIPMARPEDIVEEARTFVADGSEMVDPDVGPPQRFLEDREIEMAARVADGVYLFARLDEGREDAFRTNADLLVQLSVVQGYPVVVLALVDYDGASPYARRTALDPRDAEDRRVLGALRHEFAATVALFGVEGRFERTVSVDGARRVNVAMILERVDRLGGSAQVDAHTARERALAAPPPVREAGVPFTGEDLPPSESAARSAAALDELIAWMTPERLEHALLSLSVPRDIVDGSMRRILEDATRHGLALPPALVSRAVSVGVAAEPGELVARQITSFRATCALPDRGGLDEERVADNWEQLLAAATDAEVAIESETHDLAWRAIHAVRGDATGARMPADVDTSTLPDMGAPELVLLLEHPTARRQAALELCRRSEPELLDALFKAVRKMPRSDVVRVVPRIVELGEASGDVLIDGLTAKKTFVRQAAALALGHLRLRRAVVPLLHLLQNEPSEVWREVARVLGEFGTGAFRALSRGLKGPKNQPERLAWALAHLSNHGCAKQVEQLAADSDAKVARVAREALTLRDQAAQETARVRGSRPIEGDDGARLFSHRFYAELAGTAPEADLADVIE